MIRTMLILFTLSGTAAAAAPARSDDLKFTVALRQQNLDILQDKVLNMSNHKHADYGKFMSVHEILDLIAPPSNVSSFITEYLTKHNIRCENHRDALTCVGSYGNVSKLFKMDRERSGYVVPQALRDWTVTVEGLTANPPNGVTPKKNVHIRSNGVDPGYVGTESLQKLYNLPETGGSVKESLVSVEYQGQSGFSNDDLTTSQVQNGLKKNPITKNHTVGTDVSPDTETELDVQMESQLAEGAELWFWGSDQWLLTWAVNFFNTPVVPHIASHSWGWAIDQQCTIIPCNTTDQVYVNRVNAEYLKIAARGVTMLVASGDSGAPGRSDEVCGGVNRTVVSVFPGSSPYVLSVGATFVVADGAGAGAGAVANTNWTTPLCQQNNCSVGVTEAVVNFNNVSWTAGGGFGVDATEVQPVWQELAVQSYFKQKPPLPTNFNPKGRAYPDISVVGHNCPTWQYGGLSPTDGTSCSSPTMASIVAVLNSHQVSKGKSRLGLAGPVLYAMYYDDPSIFNDIEEGNNWCTESECCPTRSDGGSDYGYVAKKGFDPVTGLGTPNVGKILAWLDKNT